MRTAISYTRFSDPKQHGGDSVGRQAREFATFCERHKLTPATEHFHDAARSGFKGTHRRKGDLGRFEALVKAGTVPRGTVLVVEDFDRLSRERPDEAVKFLSGILTAGVDVGVAKLDNIFTESDFGTEKWLYLSFELHRAHQESKLKSQRVAASWRTRKLRARAERCPMGARSPAWIEVKGSKFRLIPDRVAAVRRIFDLIASGYGINRVVKTLTNEGVPAFGSDRGRWNRSYLAVILRDRRAVGDFQPRTVDGKPDGPPILAYYPAAVTEEQFALARASMGRRLKGRKTRQRRYVNIFNGLLRNADDREGFRLHNIGSAAKPQLVLISSSGAEGRRRSTSFPYPLFEKAFLSSVKEVRVGDILPADGEARATRLDGLKAQADHIAEQIAFLTAELRRAASPVLVAVLREHEATATRLKEEIDVETMRAAAPAEKDFDDVRTLADLVEGADDPDEIRLRLQVILRRRFSEVWALIRSRGAARLAFVQAFFADAPLRCRAFYIYYRSAAKHRQTRWGVKSLVGDTLDMRNPEELKLVATAQAKLLDAAFAGGTFDVFGEDVPVAFDD